MSKPEDLLDAMAHSVMTPPKSCPVASPELPIETSSTPPPSPYSVHQTVFSFYYNKQQMFL